MLTKKQHEAFKDWLREAYESGKRDGHLDHSLLFTTSEGLDAVIWKCLHGSFEGQFIKNEEVTSDYEAKA